MSLAARSTRIGDPEADNILDKIKSITEKMATKTDLIIYSYVRIIEDSFGLGINRNNRLGPSLHVSSLIIQNPSGGMNLGYFLSVLIVSFV